MNKRVLIATLMVYFTVTSADIVPAAEAERKPLSCKVAKDIVEVALDHHLYGKDGATSDVAKRAVENYNAVILGYADLMTAKEVAGIKKAHSLVDPVAVIASLRKADCHYFEAQALIVKNAIARAKAQIPSRAQLIKWIVSDPRGEPKLAAIKKMSDAVAKWDKQAEHDQAALFYATRFLNRLTRMSSEMREFAYAMALSSFMQALDPHSQYLSPSSAELVGQKLGMRTYGGVGVSIETATIYGVKINELSRGGAAEASGQIHPGDIILSVNGKSTLGLELDQVGDLLVGDVGSKATLKVARPADGKIGDVRTVTVERRLAKQAAVAFDVARHVVDGKIVVTIKLGGFYKGATEDVKRAIIEQTQIGDIHALVLDLRGNLGGLIDEARDLAGLFITRGPVAAIKMRSGTEYIVDANPIVYQGMVLVAVDSYSASSSEIVAGALQDYGRAIIVGDKTTFGKGTAQQILTKTEGVPVGALMVTFAQFYTAGGHSTQKEGVTSDIVVPGPLANADNIESKMNNALEAGRIGNLVQPAMKIENGDPELTQMITGLKELSAARIGAGGTFSREQQSAEIEHIAADYFELKARALSVGRAADAGSGADTGSNSSSLN